MNPSPFSIREQPQMRTRTAPTISISFTHESTSEPHGCRPIQSPLLFCSLFSCSSRGLTYNEFLTLPLSTAHAQQPTIVSIDRLEIITMQQKPAMQSLHNDENVNIVTDNYKREVCSSGSCLCHQIMDMTYWVLPHCHATGRKTV